MKKNFLKKIASAFKKPYVKVACYVGGILLVLVISGGFSAQNIWNTIVTVVKSYDMLTLCVAGLMSLTTLGIFKWFESYMEESMKLEDDHHKIIVQYDKHKDSLLDNKNSFAEKQGGFLAIRHIKKCNKDFKKPEKNCKQNKFEGYEKRIIKWAKKPASDNQSGEYEKHVKNVEKYLGGELRLCSLNVFANVAGDTTVRFDDTVASHELPPFVISHAEELLLAHKNSTKSNSDTVRLNDFDYNENSKDLALKTSRTTYYHMLLTNRCMDYKFADGLSIREIYENGNEITPLEHSLLGNQIGINGLIVTRDNYILIERRTRKKITWKNKFAQSISLALKLKDLGIEREPLNNDPETAQKKFKHIIEKTIKENFGLTPEDYAEFNMSENFLGIARDLLEGGKPNLYFYVRTNCTAAELKEKIESNMKVIRFDNYKNEGENKKVISSSKLDSEYYLLPFEDIEIDYQFRLSLNRRTAPRVYRRLYPRCCWVKEAFDKTKGTLSRVFDPNLSLECGEALLVTIAYMEMRQRWVESKNKEENQ